MDKQRTKDKLHLSALSDPTPTPPPHPDNSPAADIKRPTLSQQNDEPTQGTEPGTTLPKPADDNGSPGRTVSPTISREQIREILTQQGSATGKDVFDAVYQTLVDKEQTCHERNNEEKQGGGGTFLTLDNGVPQGLPRRLVEEKREEHLSPIQTTPKLKLSTKNKQQHGFIRTSRDLILPITQHPTKTVLKSTVKRFYTVHQLTKKHKPTIIPRKAFSETYRA
ncbi:hypothetical protein ACOMHN_015017 [Nucella lapillus]